MDFVQATGIIESDCREPKNYQSLYDACKNTKPFAKEKIIRVEDIEKLLSRICRKYQVSVNDIRVVWVMGTDNYYVANVFSNKKNHKLIYANTIYETMLKLFLYIYWLVETKMLKLR